MSATSAERPEGLSLPIELVQGLVDSVEESYLVADRKGTILLANRSARKHLTNRGFAEPLRVNLFAEVLCVEPSEVFSQIEGGQHEVKMILELGAAKFRARIKYSVSKQIRFFRTLSHDILGPIHAYYWRIDHDSRG